MLFSNHVSRRLTLEEGIEMTRKDLMHILVGARAATAYADSLAEHTNAVIVKVLLDTIFANEDPDELKQILIEMGKEISE